MKSIPESDWKKLKALRPEAIQRFCARAMGEVESLGVRQADEPDAHKVYMKLSELVSDSDEQLSWLFDDWRRSTAEITLMKWVRADLVLDDEFARFSEGVRDRVGTILDAYRDREE